MEHYVKNIDKYVVVLYEHGVLLYSEECLQNKILCSIQTGQKRYTFMC